MRFKSSNGKVCKTQFWPLWFYTCQLCTCVARTTFCTLRTYYITVGLVKRKALTGSIPTDSLEKNRRALLKMLPLLDSVLVRICSVTFRHSPPKWRHMSHNTASFWLCAQDSVLRPLISIIIVLLYLIMILDPFASKLGWQIIVFSKWSCWTDGWLPKCQSSNLWFRTNANVTEAKSFGAFHFETDF